MSFARMARAFGEAIAWRVVAIGTLLRGALMAHLFVDVSSHGFGHLAQVAPTLRSTIRSGHALAPGAAHDGN
jgi:hypothetical protein